MLNINHLTKFYGEKKILNNFNLNLNNCEIYGLLGANGAGKTTAINIICGLLNYDNGEVLINGKKISHQSKYLLGIAPQENLLYSQLTCRENLAFFGKIYGLKGTKLKTAIEKTLYSVNLHNQANQIVATLSGGMQRRLNMAIALIHDPLLLIFDEPTTGLDIEMRYDIWQLILSLKQQGKTILLTTHLLDEAEKICDRIGIIKLGKIIKEGSLNQLRTIIPAKELIFVKTEEEEEKVILEGEKQGFQYRYYQGELVFLSNKIMDLSEIIESFKGINLTSITKKDISLEYIYLEATKIID